MPDRPRHDRAVTKADRVAQQLRADITSGAIPPGGRLEQRDVAARYGTSATPAREALRQLAAQGILLHTPNVGMTVAEIDRDRLEDLHEVFLMRRALESLATEQAHDHLSRAQLADLQRVHEAFLAAHAANDMEALRAANYSFHMQIYRAGSGARLMRSIEQLWTLFPWDTWAWGVWMRPGERGSAGEHAAIVAALTAGTPREAAEAMGEHIEHAYRALTAWVREQADTGHA